MLKLNLGANNDRRDGYLSVDLKPPADIVADLRNPWPWEDSTVDEVVASHIIEHLPDRIHTMNELWRVLKPGGKADIIVPSAAHGAGWAQDPTHCSAWCLNSFLYYQQGAAEYKRFHDSYGIKACFKVIQLAEEDYLHHYETVWIVRAVLEAVK